MLTPVLVGFAIAALAIGLGWRPWAGRPAAGTEPGRGPWTGPLLAALAGAAIPIAAYTLNNQGEWPAWPPERRPAALPARARS